jgi:hypothetical protein
MYDWLCSKLPRPVVNLLYGAWYAGLMVSIALLASEPVADFYYLHG